MHIIQIIQCIVYVYNIVCIKQITRVYNTVISRSLLVQITYEYVKYVMYQLLLIYADIVNHNYRRNIDYTLIYIINRYIYIIYQCIICVTSIVVVYDIGIYKQ